MGEAASGTKTKIEALSKRLATVTKAADIVGILRELEALGTNLAREEGAADALVWPRDLNEATPPKDWGKDSEGRGG